MRTIQQIKEHATNNDTRIWSDEIAITADELRHLLAIAERGNKMRDLYLTQDTVDFDVDIDAARAAGLFGEVGNRVSAPVPDPVMLAYKEESIQLLCAAHQIAGRRGHNVGWHRFASSIKKCLEKVGINNPVTARCYHE